MAQIAFARRSDLISSLHTRVTVLSRQIDAVDSEIRSVQHEQALRSDESQTLKSGFPRPRSSAGRKGIKACRDRIKALQKKRNRLVRERTRVRDDARFHENIQAAARRPLNTKSPVRKL